MSACVRATLTGGESLTLPGGSLMTHGNNDVMELQPQLDLPMCVGIKNKSIRETGCAGMHVRVCVKVSGYR